MKRKFTSSLISSKGSSRLDACIAIGPTPGMTILSSSSSSMINNEYKNAKFIIFFSKIYDR